jgi:D-arabinose 1-dehydrogenase-like Zn-dependent alcohol dehydrogenase
MLLGAKTYGVDIKPDSLEAAKKLGAEAMTMEELKKKFDAEGIAADLVVDAVGMVKTFEKGQELLGIGGAVSFIREI